MKYGILFIAILALLVSCQNNEPESQAEGETQPLQDEKSSASFLHDGMSKEEKVSAIDAEIDRIQKENFNTPVRKIKVPENSGSIGILDHEGKPFRIAKKTTPVNEEWMTIYYILNDNIILFKQREWISHTNPPYAREVAFYMDGNGIFNAVERKANLEPGQNPSGVLGLPPVELNLDKDSLHQAVLSDFKNLQKQIAENK